MTIDEAIKHCFEVAGEQQERADSAELIDILDGLDVESCKECATNYRQLAEWLQELRVYRKLEICGNCRHYVVGTTHFGECHATSDIEPCVVGVNQTACGTFDYKDFRNGA